MTPLRKTLSIFSVILLSSPAIAANSDDDLRALSAKHPHFAGLHYDRDGNIVISQTSYSPSISEQPASSAGTVNTQTTKHLAVSEVDDDLLLVDLIETYGAGRFLKIPPNAEEEKSSDQLTIERIPNMTLAELKALKEKDTRDLVFRNVKYSFSDLYDWYRGLRDELFSVEGVHVGDIDEVLNKIEVKVYSAEAIDDVEELFARNNVPGDAFIVVYEKDRITADDTLRDQQTDISGGLQITGNGNCTMGPAVEVDGVLGVLTASHCSTFLGIPDGQQFRHVNQQLGVTTEETGRLPNCPGGGGRVCIEADAAFIPYPAGVSGATAVYKTETLNNNDIEIWRNSNGTPRRWNNLYLLGVAAVGDRVYKTGRTTGTSSGDVTAVCADINVGTGFRYLCHTEVTGANASDFATFGDSGAPVVGGPFTNYSQTTFAEFLGLHVAGNPTTDYFSPIAAIEASMGVDIDL